VGDSEKELYEILESIYAAVENPTGWSQVLGQLTELAQAKVGTLDLYDLSARRGNVEAAWNLDPDFGRIYAEQFAGKNVWMNSPRALAMRPGVAVTGQMLVPDEEVVRSEFHHELLRPQDLFHLVGGRVLERGVFVANLSLMRPKSRGPFGSHEMALLNLVMRHVLRALQMQTRISRIASQGEALSDLLDRIPLGVIAVDRAGRPLLVNRTASEMGAAKDGLVIRKEGVKASCSRETERLLGLVAEASAALTSVARRPGGTLHLTRPSSKPALVVLVAPLAPVSRFLDADGASAVIFVTDPTASPPENSEAVASLFGLTSAETRICQHLAQGRSIGEVARDLKVSPNTARTHLKRIFEKTGTHRQAELVLLLTRGVPFVREI
jgi:DNA-binding CsgD family transcriptional regulator/PAS domain-containing protein